MSGMSYEEFKSELMECAVAIDQTSQNLAAANKEYERTKAEFFEKQDTATPQERYDLGQDMHAARKDAEGCRAAQASALEEFGELVQAHPEYANRASEELAGGEKDTQAPAPESNSLQEAMSSAWQSLSEGAGKLKDAATSNVAKHLFAAGIVAIAALEEPAVLNHETLETLEAHRTGVERQVTPAEEAQQSPAAQAHSGAPAAAAADPHQATDSQHHHSSQHQHLVWPKLQPDKPEDEEHRVASPPPVNHNSDWQRAPANDNNPRTPDSPQAARALPPQVVNESVQAVGPAVRSELVPPPPPPPPPPEPEAERARSR